MQTTPSYRVAAVNEPLLRYGWLGWFLATWLGGWLAESLVPLPINYIAQQFEAWTNGYFIPIYWPIVGLILGIGAILSSSLLGIGLVYVTPPISNTWRKLGLVWMVAFLFMDVTFRWHEIQAFFVGGIPAGFIGLGIGYGFYLILKAFLDRAWILIPVSGIAMILGHSIFIQFVKTLETGLVRYRFGSVDGIHALEYYFGRGAQWAVYGLITALALGLLSQRRAEG
ncbi:hypothetical protein ACP8Y2_03715 [Herpetosiphon llansteffanensis]